MGFCVGGGRFIQYKSVNYRLPPSKRFGIWRISLAFALYKRSILQFFFAAAISLRSQCFWKQFNSNLRDLYLTGSFN